ncbi:Flp family type IVb pilin [Celeribacter halophilus]|uniref:Flp family type IVb pilin n=1 Tax=Celeribacter halophilus TaxID=576117 RepID=UPI003A93B569
MKFFKLAKTFSRDEDGAVTVDWVVLTAAIVGLGIAVITSVSTSVSTLGDNIGTELGKTSLIGAGTGYDSTTGTIKE